MNIGIYKAVEGCIECTSTMASMASKAVYGLLQIFAASMAKI